MPGCTAARRGRTGNHIMTNIMRAEVCGVRNMICMMEATGIRAGRDEEEQQRQSEQGEARTLDWQWEMGQQQRLIADLTADAKRQAASTASRMSASEADQARLQLATARQAESGESGDDARMQEKAFCDFNAACAQVAHATKKDQVAGRFAGAGGNRSAATRVGTTEIPMSGGYAAYPPSMARPSIIPPSGEEREYQVDEGNRNPQDSLRGNRTDIEPFFYTGGGGDCPSQNSKIAEEVESPSPGSKSSKPMASDVIQKLYLAAMKQKEKAEHVEAGGGDAARAPPGL
eukprot:g11164.t1